ncbi:demethylspheroidene O-methyltransferase [Natronocella acetinitrilica]|uniref:Demethylspheroidene O-methyltransferase n=1 Tax=Natronocella acetinitrilica TaxID=414046 RepID=A0AAE3G8M9_9GAMM|nr:methyltransferase [Natronocella acetinitrilica]MCP1675837.1 demethylspheroidene O-methyltransferase [Natronocella acetinitrilica]
MIDTLRDGFRELRNRLLSSSRFQRGAAAFWPTRPIARRRAAQLFDLCAGFVYSQVLLACVRLGLLELLAERPQSSSEVAARLNITVPAAERLLAAAVALRLAEPRSGDRYGLGNQGAVLSSMPGVAAMIEHHALLYRDMEDPVALLRKDRGDSLGSYWPYAGAQDPAQLTTEQVAPYSRLMSLSQELVSTEVLEVFSLRRFRRLMDVGGGDGTFIRNVAARWPHLQGIVADLPAVAEQATQRIREAGLQDRLSAVGVDFFRDSLPPGSDLISLIRIVHDHDDADVHALLGAVFRALDPGGTILIAEPMSATRGAEAMGDAYFGFYLLAMGKGRPRTPQEITKMLRHTGFRDIKCHRGRNPLQARIISGHKPSIKC